MLISLLNSTRRPTFALAQRLMTTLAQPVFTPPIHRGLTELDRDLFRLEVPLLAARVPAALTTTYSHQQLKK